MKEAYKIAFGLAGLLAMSCCSHDPYLYMIENNGKNKTKEKAAYRLDDINLDAPIKPSEDNIRKLSNIADYYDIDIRAKYEDGMIISICIGDRRGHYPANEQIKKEISDSTGKGDYSIK